MKKFLLLSVLGLFVTIAKAQPFTPEKDKFFKEVSKYIFLSDNQEIKEFVFKFERYIQTQITQQRLLTVVATCNAIHNKNLSPHPDFYNYLKSVLYTHEKKVSQSNIDVWQALLKENLEKSNVKYAKEYIELTANFFENGSLHRATNFEYVAYGGTYNFRKGENGLEIAFEDANLVCRTQLRGGKAVDSMAMIQTSGVYDMDKLRWQGRGGQVTWEKVGLNSTQTFAELANYEVKMRTTQYLCDTVMLTTPYFDKPIAGSLIDRTWNISREADKTFPQFTSFNKKLSIPDIVENIDYQGGFMMKGKTFVGVGTSASKASISYKDGNDIVYTVRANEVNIEERVINIKNGELFFKLGTKDSLTHKMVGYSYRFDERVSEFYRDKSGLGVSPFVSSYHELEMYADRIMWTADSSNLYFRWGENTSIEERYAKFESTNYFNGRQYDLFGGNSSRHPLVSLLTFVQSKGTNVISEGEAATALGGLVEQVKDLMLNLAGAGFISYDLDNKMVTVLPKTERFVNSKANKIDYDNLIFESDLRPLKISDKRPEEIANDPKLQRLQEIYEEKNAANRLLTEFASIDLQNLEFFIQGCPVVPISDVRNTQIFPKSGTVKVFSNRNFAFSGWVNVGKVEIDVVQGLFQYKTFDIVVGSSNKTFLAIKPQKSEDGTRAIISQSSITGIQGSIKVDHPSNRSGAKMKLFQAYPKLVADKPSRVFYSDKSIQKGAYDSTRFYFEVDPFELDSLTAYNDKAFRLAGTMNTGGIFPNFKEQIKIMPDYSFGFSLDAPKEGFAFYGSESKYNNKILLSNNGLQGSGTIEYVTSIAESIGLLTFMPDSTVGNAKFVTHPREDGVQMPDVSANEVFITYVPKNDLLKARSLREPMNFFNEEAKFVGTVFVRPDGFRGAGKFNMPTAQLYSANYTASRWIIDADTSNFNLRNTFNEADEGTIAFGSENVRCKVDFKARKGEFISNSGTSLINFPVNQFVCKMDKFTWVMDVDELELEKNPDATADITIDTEMGLSNSNFFSTNPKQDSLDFLSLKARFDYKQKTIYCYKVEFVDVADARIFPDKQELVIRKKASIDPLENATIVANYITKFHTFINVDCNIYGKRSYVGSGEYEYVDMVGTKTNFYLKNITLDNTFQTVAEGQIPQTAAFKLSPYFDFYGKFSIRAALATIKFDGSTRVIHDCKDFSKNWMTFVGDIDPKNVLIPIEKTMKSENGNLVTSGVAWNYNKEKNESKMYPVFLSELISNEDENLISPTGFLLYNPEANEYRISNKEKLENRSAPGTYLALHTPTCALNGDGEINLGIKTPGVFTSTIGTIKYDPKTRETSMNVTMKIDMFFDKSTLEKVGEKMAGMPNLLPISLNEIKQNTTLEQALTAWGDVTAADKLISDYGLKKSLRKMPNEYESTMIITNIQLFSIDSIPKFGGLSSNSAEACLVSLYKEPVMRKIPIEVAFYKNDKGIDQFGIYIVIPALHNYYFHYEVDKKDGRLKLVTSDTETKNRINALKPDKRKNKEFEYEISTNTALYQAFRQLLKI